MKMKHYVSMLAGITAVGLLLFLTIAQTADSAAQCRIVRIYDENVLPGEGNIRIEPQNVFVDGTACIIWVNLGKAKMKITFTEGKNCVAGTAAASGFSMTDACYITGWIPYGATSSLTFKGKGIYQYVIEWESLATKAVGKIVVQ